MKQTLALCLALVLPLGSILGCTTQSDGDSVASTGTTATEPTTNTATSSSPSDASAPPAETAAPSGEPETAKETDDGKAPVAQNAGPPPVPPKDVAQPETDVDPTLGHPTEDGPLYEWIRERFAKVPRGKAAAKVTPAEREAVFALVDNTAIGAHYHYKNFPESVHRAEVTFMLGRVLFLNRARHERVEIQRWRDRNPTRTITGDDIRVIQKAYAAPLAELAKEGLGLVSNDDVRYELHKLQADSHQVLSEHAEAVKSYEAALAVKPDGPETDNLQFNICDSLESAQRYDECIARCNQYLEKWNPNAFYHPHMFYTGHKAHRKAGLLEEGIAYWGKYLPKLKAVATGDVKVDDPDVHRAHEEYYDRSFFYHQGFFNFALGDFEAAKQGFEAYIDHVDEKVKLGQWTSPATPAYRDSQAVPYLNTIYTQIGNPAAPFALGEEHWVVPAEFEPDSSPSSAVLFFCPSQKRRYRKLFPILDSTVASYEGIQLVWISYPKSSDEGIDAAYGKILEEWDAKGIENTSALLDDNDSSLHKKYEATRGSGDLYIVDDEGNVQWRVIDPMYWDDGLIRAVLNRVFRED